MSSNLPTMNRAGEEAAQWFSKLNEASVSSETLNAFYAWRKIPDNHAAYRRVERTWDTSGKLAGDPDVQAALASAKVRAKRRRAWSVPRLGFAFASAAALCAAVFLYTGNFAASGDVFATAVGEQRTLALADGSHVRLDTDSRIRVHFRRGLRSVVLDRGQALFDVAHRSDEPFEVKVGKTEIHDLGTLFDVRKTKETVQVTLIDGSIAIGGLDARQPVLTLRPGQQITTGVGATQAQSVDASRFTSWTTGRLVFEDLPLQEATAEINRYADHKITLAAGGVESIRVTGTFNTNDPGSFASAVAKLYDLSVHRQANGDILLEREATSSPTKKSSAPPG
jgi:transmembrane sensor